MTSCVRINYIVYWNYTIRIKRVKEMAVMDPVTHALVGVTQGVMLSKDKEEPISKKNAVLLASVLGNIAPDIDVVIRVIYGELVYLKYHRVFTHSIPGAVLISLGIMLILRYFFPKESRAKLFVISFIGTSFHVFFDVLTSYGTQALWPFDKTRMAWDVLMIVDPIIILVIVLGLALFKWKTWSVHRIFNFITLFMILYVGSRFYMHNNLEALVKKEYAGEPIKKFSVLPAVFGVNKWNLILETPTYYKVGDVDFFNQKVIIKKVFKIRPKDKIIMAAEKKPGVMIFNEFARYPYTNYEKVGDNYIIRRFDLRYSFNKQYPFTLQQVLNKKLKLVTYDLVNYWEKK